MSKLKLQNVSKNYGDVQAVDNLSFEVQAGEFFSILGPSGSGKTTTLRSITGFEDISDGTILIDDNSVNELPPNARDIGMVFQGFALFPHKTVEENVEYGLKVEGIPKKKRNEKVNDMLSKVGLTNMGSRMPEELSGGQQQRVALARALILEPEILVLDEPLSSLDRALRQQMRYELKRLHNEIEVTTVYVTHNQKEALSLSDRILVMNDGTAEQIGAPEEIYYEPNSLFVAEFIGESNIFSIDKFESYEDINKTNLAANGSGVKAKKSGKILIRPENMQVTEPSKSQITGEIKARSFQGNRTTYVVNIGHMDCMIEKKEPNYRQTYSYGDEVGVTWDQNASQIIHP